MAQCIFEKEKNQGSERKKTQNVRTTYVQENMNRKKKKRKGILCQTLASKRSYYSCMKNKIAEKQALHNTIY